MTIFFWMKYCLSCFCYLDLILLLLLLLNFSLNFVYKDLLYEWKIKLGSGTFLSKKSDLFCFICSLMNMINITTQSAHKTFTNILIPKNDIYDLFVFDLIWKGGVWRRWKETIECSWKTCSRMSKFAHHSNVIERRHHSTCASFVATARRHSSSLEYCIRDTLQFFWIIFTEIVFYLVFSQRIW